jgi:site-specific recombinase XerD
MNTPERFAELVHAFFCDYLIKQRDLSPRTVSAYRDTFRLLLSFLQQACGKRPDQLMLSNLTAAQLTAFLQYLEEERGNCVTTQEPATCAWPRCVRFFVMLAHVRGRK